MSTAVPKNLTLATYGCPSQSMEYYHLIKSYLESSTGINITLVYETDRAGPAMDRGDHTRIDLAFVSTRYGLDLGRSSSDGASPPYSILPVGAVTAHPTNHHSLPASWSVVVVRSDNSANLKGFLDLRGSKVTVSDQRSLSGTTALLHKLHQSGENAAFFSLIRTSGSHHACLDQLVFQSMEVTVVDALAYHSYIRQYPQNAAKLRVFMAIGPHPPHPLVVNNNLDAATRQQVLSALLALKPGTFNSSGSVSTGGSDNASVSGSVSISKWLERLQPHGVLGFAAASQDLYDEARKMLEDCQQLSLGVTYY